jgi:hypothetical protein
MGKRAWLASGLLMALSGMTACQTPSHLDPSMDPSNPNPFDPIPTPLDGTGHFLDVRVMSPSPVTLADSPPPITGGTLYVTQPGDIAIVADPDRDRIVVVDLVAGAVSGIASLPPGAEPFRATEDFDGRIHVVLRGTGDVFSFMPAAVASGERHHVCAMPRGIAFDEEDESLVVACRSGALVRLGTDGAIRSTVQVEADLRDVVITSGRLFVSTFRTANLLELDPHTGTVMGRTQPETAPNFGGSFEGGPRRGGAGGFAPGVAWRTVEMPQMVGTHGAHAIAAVHQRASDTPVEPSPGGYSGGGGGMSPCDESSIVQSAVTIYSLDGTHTEGTQLRGATLPVDIAFSRDGQRVTVIAAANESGDQAVQTYDVTAIRSGGGGTCLSPTIARDAPDAQVITNPIAAAYDGVGRLIVQQREPSQLVYMGRTIPLNYLDGRRAEARFDTGHAVFHGNSGAFIACASCHPEGGDDGRVWNFDGIGDRRTPALHGDLRGTEPFHWDGDMTDLHVLVHQVFTSRMSGPELPAHHVDALGNWLDAIPAPVHETGADEAAVTRGQDLFYGDAECATCHSGPLMTNNETVDVGTGGHFQVPSLIGVSYRTPLMHDGACPTLRARLTDAACSGGEHHGHTSGLTPGQVNDMVAFLNTL